MAGLPVCLLAGRQASRMASKPDGRMDGRQVGARAGLQASVCMFTRIFIHANSHSVRLASIHADITTLLRPLILSFPFFFWAAWASGNDALRAGITAQNSIRLLADYCFHEKAARCPSSYPKAFSVTAENGSSKVCFELLKTFRVTPENLLPGCLSEVGQPFFRIS